MTSMTTRRLGQKRSRGAFFISLIAALVCCSSYSQAGIPETRPGNDLLAGEQGGLRLGLAWERGLVPPFRAGERDRQHLWMSGFWHPAPYAWLDASYEVLHDQYPDGTEVSGSGDLELGTLLGWEQTGPVGEGGGAGGGLGWAAAVGWRAKLPNAADAGELGSDETDITLLARGGLLYNAVCIDMSAGLAILGNPLRYADQDDVPFVSLALSWRPQAAASDGALPLLLPVPGLHGTWAFATSRNPARADVSLRLEWGRDWRWGLEGGAGLVPAAADIRGALWFGRAWGAE